MYFFIYTYFIKIQTIFFKFSNQTDPQIPLPNEPRDLRFFICFFFIKRQNFIQKRKTRYTIIKGKHPSNREIHKLTREDSSPHYREKNTNYQEKAHTHFIHSKSCIFSGLSSNHCVRDILEGQRTFGKFPVLRTPLQLLPLVVVGLSQNRPCS